MSNVRKDIIVVSLVCMLGAFVGYIAATVIKHMYIPFGEAKTMEYLQGDNCVIVNNGNVTTIITSCDTAFLERCRTCFERVRNVSSMRCDVERGYGGIVIVCTAQK